MNDKERNLIRRIFACLEVPRVKIRVDNLGEILKYNNEIAKILELVVPALRDMTYPDGGQDALDEAEEYVQDLEALFKEFKRKWQQ